MTTITVGNANTTADLGVVTGSTVNVGNGDDGKVRVELDAASSRRRLGGVDATLLDLRRVPSRDRRLRAFERLPCGVDELNRNPRIGERQRDPGAHRPRADHCRALDRPRSRSLFVQVCHTWDTLRRTLWDTVRLRIEWRFLRDDE